MKKQGILLLITIFLTSCEIQNSNSNSVLESSSFSYQAKEKKDITVEKEYYKSQVNRGKIIYSSDFINDNSHEVKELEIYEINDTHGAFYDEDFNSNIYSISRVKTLINQESNDPYAVVKIANGDLLQGSAFSNTLLGEPAICALNEMDFDCFTIGNHEFDWGLDSLSVYKDGNLDNGELDCDFLGANIIDKNGNMPSFIKPYTIVNKGDLKVGIIGVIGDTLESSISSIALNGYSFTSSVEAVQKYSKILKEEKNVDVIIVGCHDHSEFTNQKFVDNSKVDAIINGHDHYRVEEYVTRKSDNKQIPVCESNTKNLTVGKISLSLDENKLLKDSKIEHFYADLYEKDSKLDELMQVYYEVIDSFQNTKIGYHTGGFSKKDIAISTCNYLNSYFGTDIAFINQSGVRAKITSSYITNGDVYEVFPFDNEMYIAKLNGYEVKKICGTGNYYNSLGLANGTYINTSSIENDKYYYVATVDFLATKNSYLTYFNEKHNLIKTGEYIRDLAIDNIKENYKIS